MVIPFPHIEVSLQYYSILTLSRFEFGHPTLGTIVQLYTLEERTIQYCCKEVLICNKSLAYDLTLRYNYWNCVSKRFLETCKFSLSYIPSWNQLNPFNPSIVSWQQLSSHWATFLVRNLSSTSSSIVPGTKLSSSFYLLQTLESKDHSQLATKFSPSYVPGTNPFVYFIVHRSWCIVPI